MKVTLAILALFALALPSLASSTNSLTAGELEIKGAVDKVMVEFSHGEPGEAVTTLFEKYWADHAGASSKAAELSSRFKSDMIRNQAVAGGPRATSFLELEG
jgi:hypothetical protein